ncbi:MAG: methyl-accepting chemotaxis protein, partial [bacterium]|nr:methyl-accepting chemotaxis protein [bacterium]
MFEKLRARIRNPRLVTRIILSPVVALVMFLLIIAVNVIIGNQVRLLVAEIKEGFVPGVANIRDLQANMASLPPLFRDAIREADTFLLDEETDPIRDRTVTLLDEIRANASFSAEDTENLDTLFLTYYTYARASSERNIERGEEFTPQDEALVMVAQLKELNELIGKLDQASRAGLNQKLESLQANQATANWAIPIISGLAILILSAFGYNVFRSVKQPIEEAVYVADQLSRGNMETEVHTERQDEIGQLLQSMQRMLVYLREMAGMTGSMATGDLRATIEPRSEQDLFGSALKDMSENLREMIGRVKLASGQVGQSSEEISASSTQITKGAESQSASADETLSTMVEIAAQIDSVAKSSQALAVNVDETSSSIQEMGASIEEVAKNSTNMLASVEQTSSTIEEMAASIQSIEAKVRVVDDVSREAAR